MPWRELPDETVTTMTTWLQWKMRRMKSLHWDCQFILNCYYSKYINLKCRHRYDMALKWKQMACQLCHKNNSRRMNFPTFEKIHQLSTSNSQWYNSWITPPQTCFGASERWNLCFLIKSESDAVIEMPRHISHCDMWHVRCGIMLSSFLHSANVIQSETFAVWRDQWTKP